jgi:hypothetical protein
MSEPQLPREVRRRLAIMASATTSALSPVSIAAFGPDGTADGDNEEVVSRITAAEPSRGAATGTPPVSSATYGRGPACCLTWAAR